MGLEPVGPVERVGTGIGLTARGARAEGPTWAEVLDALEQRVADAEESLRDPSRATPPPAALPSFEEIGPIPLDERERAARLLQRQLEAAEALAERITTSKRQRDVLGRMSTRPTRPTAAYFDRPL